MEAHLGFQSIGNRVSVAIEPPNEHGPVDHNIVARYRTTLNLICVYEVTSESHNTTIERLEVGFGPSDLYEVTFHRELQRGRYLRSWLILGLVGGHCTSAITAVGTRHIEIAESSKGLFVCRALGRGLISICGYWWIM